jgi:O-antigen/teichoic acid export membrane protein
MTLTTDRPEPRVATQFAGNVAARLGALGALGAATVMVARVGGPDLVGAFTLLRVLPGLAGVLAAAGLPGAAPYFLGAYRDEPRLRPTLVALTWLGAAAATAGWLAFTPVLHRLFFRPWGVGIVVVGGLAVFSQLFVAVGKALLQGGQDMRGANGAIVAEEAAFLPIYGALLVLGRGTMVMLVALAVTDVVVAASIAERLRRRGFFRDWGRPSWPLGRKIVVYGARGQLGGLLSLVNLRLDVAILGALAGPAVLGIYAIASKYAELLRLPGLAVNYVLYPLFSRRSARDARARTRSLIGPVAGLTALCAGPLAFAAGPLLPLLYGHAFTGAIHPAWILLGGLLGDGLTGLVGAYLFGVGRPGLNSLAIAAGVVVTVVGDLVLIPRYGAVGAAWASAAAYLTTVATLLVCFWSAGRPGFADKAATAGRLRAAEAG